MIWLKLALSLAILFGLFLIWRRAPYRINRSFGPIGQFVTINGAKVHYHQTGAGPDVILLHGASGNLRDWEFGLRDALQTRYRVTAFDRPGHGHSDRIAGHEHLATSAAHLRAAAEVLGIKDFILLGHSYGGSVALAWALQVAPHGLMLISAPSLPWPGRLDLWYRINKYAFISNILVRVMAVLVLSYYVKFALRKVFFPALIPPDYVRRMGLALALRPKSMRANVAQVNALLSDIRGQMGDYPRLTLPISLIHGGRDTIVPPHLHSIPLAAALPHADLRIIKDAGHMPHHSHLDLVIASLARLCNPR